MFELHYDPVEQDTDRYLAECSDAQESMEADAEEVEDHCAECCICHKKIMPRDTALTIDEGDHYFHEDCAESASGEEIAINRGCDSDVMERYLEDTQ